jgi:hypothetical protein
LPCLSEENAERKFRHIAPGSASRVPAGRFAAEVTHRRKVVTVSGAQSSQETNPSFDAYFARSLAALVSRKQIAALA